MDAEDLFGEDGLLKRMKKRMAERILEAELTDHLGYEKHAPDGRNRGNSRNGKTTKTLKDDRGDLPVDIPRDREGSFDPKLIRKYQTRWPDFDDKIISMYARGMSTRDIQGHVEDLYGVSISPELVSRITDTVADEVTAWQSRPLDEIYPILFLDALFVKIRDSGSIQNKAVYLAWASTLPATRNSWVCGSTRTKGQVLAQRLDRTEEPRGQRHLHRLLRRPVRLPAGP